ncbi:MAG: AMIN domain-containing protein [Chlamydiota bacterium]
MSRPEPELCSPPAVQKYSLAGPGLLFRNPAWQSDPAELGKVAQVWNWCEWLRISLMAASLLAAGIASGAKAKVRQAQNLQALYPPSVVSASETHSSPLPAADPGGPATLGAIHYWSDDLSTTVTVGLPGLVFFAAHRLTHPDRVYFDLRGTQMPADVHGRLIQVDVSETFVHKIRVAERKGGVTRVVLETTPHCHYSAMIASDPYRLIIHLHASE